MESYNFTANRPSENYHKSDIWLLISMILIWGLGMFALVICSANYAERLYNNSYAFVIRQLICSGFGFLLFLFFFLLDMSVIRKMLPYIVLGTILLCLLTFIPGIGVERNGARRWIKMPFNFSFQPSELVKFTVVLFLANLFDKQQEIENPDEKNVLPCVIGLFIFLILVLLQKDFSTTVFIAGIGVLLFFVSGTKLTWIFPAAVLIIPIAILMIVLEPYRLDRIIGFLKPMEGSSTINYQSLAAKRAISAGGVWGSGIGSGLVRMNSIPEIQADYIFAGWAEAMGFVGVVSYFLVLMLFTWRGYKASLSCPDRFAAYTSFGCVSIIFLQSLVNCMVVSGLLPSTGIPLPFFSLGGSSIMVTLAMCGFILNASRCEESERSYIRESKNNESMDTFELFQN